MCFSIEVSFSRMVTYLLLLELENPMITVTPTDSLMDLYGPFPLLTIEPQNCNMTLIGRAILY